MAINLDNQSVDISCPSCGKEIPEKIGRLKQNPKLTCRSCGATVTVDADQFRSVEQSVKKALDNLGKGFGKF
ncbi:hypothetical protein RA280_19660 [Cupriavidus sp. CV2]|uniref:hypothetical protein n=1 Tax=Cupriavidus ulmosensis TaxID=3065913 RepID=UPI00296B4FA6|nr:hypothetical protein [Cupriavidus sp. CV2]MDW3683920.1 hypothetical protein [Cupriavidus sp. CV2]